jgi:hypothetical protein
MFYKIFWLLSAVETYYFQHFTNRLKNFAKMYFNLAYFVCVLWLTGQIGEAITWVTSAKDIYISHKRVQCIYCFKMVTTYNNVQFEYI